MVTWTRQVSDGIEVMLSGLWMFVAIGKSEKSDKWIQAQRVGKGNSAGHCSELESQKVGP